MSPLLHILILKEPLVTMFFFYPKMFVVSYCQIYYLHPSLNLDKIAVFRSFWQKAEEICGLSHFKQEHVAYFDRTAFFQLKDAASPVSAREKSTSLAESFSTGLKLAIDTLNAWFSNTIKPKFIELNDIKKQIYMKENPIVPSKIIYCTCGFLLDIQPDGEHKR